VEQLAGSVVVSGWHFEKRKRLAACRQPMFCQILFCLNFSLNPSAEKPLPQRLRLGALAK
jgi:hypothetical protein